MKSLKKLLRSARRWGNYAFFREYRYKRVVRHHLRQYYSPDVPLPSRPLRPTLICMADGKCLHGGLADRLRSFVTFYGYCLEHGLKFAIHFDFPFRLKDYLLPNAYNWILQPGELTFNSKYAHAVYMDNTGDTGPREMKFQRRISHKLLSRNRYVQHHVYSSFYFDEANFGKYFHQLFRPSEKVAAAIKRNRQALGDRYISVSARFLELLGDFHEPKGGIRLGGPERQALLDRSVAKVKELHTLNPDCRILVTSDSRSFLNACLPLGYVHIVDGEISHVDTPGEVDHTKTFVDFLLIAEAEKVFQIKTGPMYGGNFSLRAAQAGGKSHCLIEF